MRFPYCKRTPVWASFFELSLRSRRFIYREDRTGLLIDRHDVMRMEVVHCRERYAVNRLCPVLVELDIPRGKVTLRDAGRRNGNLQRLVLRDRT